MYTGIMFLLLIAIVVLGIVVGYFIAEWEETKEKLYLKGIWFFGFVLSLCTLGVCSYHTMCISNRFTHEKPEVEYQITEYQGVKDTLYIYHFKK